MMDVVSRSEGQAPSSETAGREVSGLRLEKKSREVIDTR